MFLPRVEQLRSRAAPTSWVPSYFHIDPANIILQSSGYLVELAKEVAVANTTVKAGACSKLEIIAQQIRFLQEQARQVKYQEPTGPRNTGP